MSCSFGLTSPMPGVGCATSWMICVAASHHATEIVNGTHASAAPLIHCRRLPLTLKSPGASNTASRATYGGRPTSTTINDTITMAVCEFESGAPTLSCLEMVANATQANAINVASCPHDAKSERLIGISNRANITSLPLPHQ